MSDVEDVTGLDEMAEHEYNEALSICRSLAKTTPENFDSYIALILSNLANLHKDINRINEAEREYQSLRQYPGTL